MLTMLTLTAMLFIADNGDLSYGGEYVDGACGDALLTVERDAVCVSQESVLAPSTSPRPRANPRRGN